MRERKPIDPALRRFLDEQAAAAPSTGEMTDEQRTAFVRSRMVKALESRTSIPGLPNEVQAHDVAITSALSGRVYTPAATQRPLPMLVYLHGGGWAAGSVATHDPFCRLLSHAAGIIIASVDYRLSPEHPHPSALEDALAAMRWARSSAAEWGGEPSRLALGGDSSGAHLAAVAANQLSAKSRPPAALLLIFPVTDHPSANHPSWTENASGYGLEASLMRWYWQQYAAGNSPDDSHVSPLRLHEIPALPATLVVTAEYDLLRDEGIAYAEKLANAGVPMSHLHIPDMHHNFAVHPATVARFPQSDVALAQIANWLRATLKAGSS